MSAYLFSAIPDDSPWAYLKDPSYFPWSHAATPFIFQVYTNNWILTGLLVFINEFFEAFAFASVGNYLVFTGAIEGRETIYDSLIGDVINGLFGILLGIYFRYVFSVPEFFPRPYSNNIAIWWLHIVQVSIIGISSTQLDFKFGPPMIEFNRYAGHIGAYIFIIVTVIVLFAAYYWNASTPKLRTRIWANTTSAGYKLIWGMLILHMLVFFVLFIYNTIEPYILSWLAIAVLFVFDTIWLLVFKSNMVQVGREKGK